MNTAAPERDPLDRLAEEFAQRYRRGERPSLTEYTQKYPELADQIRDLFPALAVMEELGSVAESPTSLRARAEPARVPQQLGEYRLLRELGRGGMGIVYEAIQENLGRHVALKVLPAYALAVPSLVERFKREARAAARLHHTRIVPVFGVGEHEGIHYYAMQYIQGQPLDTVMRELRRLWQSKGLLSEDAEHPPSALTQKVARGLMTGQFSVTATTPLSPPSEEKMPELGLEPGPADAARTPTTLDSSGPLRQSALYSQTETQYFRSVARVGNQVAEALEYAHRQGVLHRDIKPSNLLLDAQGDIWVTDFGLAKSEGTTGLTSPGDIVGTLCYMAPERFQGKSDARSDLYSLGTTLYELLTLQPAFQDSDRARLIQRVSSEEPQRPRKLDPRIPRDLETIVLRAMSKEPGDRYQAAADLGEDLRRFLAYRPIRARRISSLEQTWRWCRRNPAVAGLLVTLLAALLGGIAGVAWQWRRAEINLQAAHVQRGRADANARKARQAFDEAFTQISESKLINVPGVQPLRQELLLAALRYYQEFVEEARDDPELQADLAAAQFRVACVNIFLDRDAEAWAALKEGLDRVEKLLAAHHKNHELPKRLAGFLQSASRLHSFVGSELKLSRNDGTLQRAIQLWAGFAQDYPDVRGFRSDLALLYLLQVEQLRNQAALEEAVANCSTAFALAKGLIREEPATGVYYQIIDRACSSATKLLRSSGKPQNAVPLLREAVAFLEEQAGQHPDVPRLGRALASMLVDLGYCLGDCHRWSEAQSVHARALSILQAWSDRTPGDADTQFDLAKTYSTLGHDFEWLGRHEESEQSSRRAAALAEKLATMFPDVPSYRQEWAEISMWLGIRMAIRNRLGEAETWLRQAVRVRQAVASRHPEIPWYSHDLWRARFVLTWLLFATGRVKETEPDIRDSQKLFQRLTAEHPEEPRYFCCLAQSEMVLGHLLAALGRSQESGLAFHRSAELIRAKPAYFFEDRFFREQYPIVVALELLKRARRYTETERLYRQVIETLDLLSTLHPADADFLTCKAKDQIELAGWLQAQERPRTAEQIARSALGSWRALLNGFALSRDVADRTVELGKLLNDSGRLPESADAFRIARDAYQLFACKSPDEVGWRVAEAATLKESEHALVAAGKTKEAWHACHQALDAYQRLTATCGSDPAWEEEQGQQLRLLGSLSLHQSEQAEVFFRRAAEVFAELAHRYPHHALYRHWQADTHHLMGDVLAAQRRRREAEAAYRQALLLFDDQGPETLGVWVVSENMRHTYQSLIRLLGESGRPGEAKRMAERAATQYEGQLTAAIQAHPDVAQVWRTRGLFYAALGRWRDAARDYARALALQPEDKHWRFEGACCSLLAGDRTAWRHFCAAELDRLRTWPDQTETAGPSFMAARMLALFRDPGIEPAELVRLAEKNVAVDLDPWHLHVKALVYYRTGLLDAALEQGRLSMQQHPNWHGQALDWALLGLVYLARGNSAESQKWLEKARNALPVDVFSDSMHPNDRLEMRVLLREAEEMLRNQGRSSS
jgi:serine/threonine-protein kinase